MFKICSDFTKCERVSAFFGLRLRLYQSHYEVLNLGPNCTARDIKKAYIRLSKLHHPDVNKNKESHDKILRINEAYRVLSKAETRRAYDLGLARPTQHYTDYEFRRPPRSWEFTQEQPYYGIDGIKRVANRSIVFGCLILTFVGVVVQFYLIRHSVTLRREDILQKSIETEEVLNGIRSQAVRHGNEHQIASLEAKLKRNNNK